MKTCLNCNQSFPWEAVVDGKLRHLQSRKYCLKCSPFGSNNRLKLHDPEHRHRPHGPNKRESANDPCELCGSTKNLGRRRCYTCYSRIRRYRVKAKAVALLGGKCNRCGWTGDIAAFEFHHQADKDFTISLHTNRSWEVVKAEVLKCELVCSNCHRIEHTGDRGESFMRAVAEYRGQLLA